MDENTKVDPENVEVPESVVSESAPAQEDTPDKTDSQSEENVGYEPAVEQGRQPAETPE